MKNKFLIFFLLSSLLLLIDCKKRVFGHITLKGTIKDYFTGKAIPSQISVSGRHNQDSTRSFGLGVFETDAEGNFDIKVQAVRTDQYSLYFYNASTSTSSWHENAGRIGYINIQKNTSMDFGTITESSRSFYCRVLIKHTETEYDCFSTNILLQTNPYSFCEGVGKSAEFIHRAVYSKTDFEGSNKNYILSYLLSGKNGQKYMELSIPIPPGNDTVSASINF